MKCIIPSVYNVISSVDNPIKWIDLSKHLKHFTNLYPLTKVIYIPFNILTTSNIYIFRIFKLLFESIPGWIVDSYLEQHQQQKSLLKFIKKFHNFQSTNSYTMHNKWTFECGNISKLFQT